MSPAAPAPPVAPTDTAALADEICRVGRSLFERGLVHGSTGNISARLADGGVLITPTDACLGFLDPARLADVGPDGAQRGGARASKTLALHRRIYDAAPDARCIVHTHSTHLVALTLAGVWRDDDVVPPITPYQVMKVGHVPLVACDVRWSRRAMRVGGSPRRPRRTPCPAFSRPVPRPRPSRCRGPRRPRR